MDDIYYNGVAILSSIVQPNELFKIIQFGLTAILIIIGIAYKIWRWYKEAKADGKITKEEIKDIVEDVSPDIKDLVDVINDLNDDSDKTE